MSVQAPVRPRTTPAPVGESPVRRRAAAAALALLAWVALAVTYAVAVLTPLGQALDTQWMTEVAAASLSEHEWPEAVLDLVSAATVLLGVAVVSTVALAARGAAAAWVAGSVAVATMAVAQLLKAGLPRPSYLLADVANSLPSGHVAAVAGLAVAAWLAVGAAARPVVALLGTVAVAVTGVATVAEAWHRPSDVLAAALLAVAVGATGATVLGSRAG